MPSPGQAGTIALDAAIQRYFEVALYLLVLSGFGTLASTGGLDVPTMVLVSSALFYRGYLLGKRRTMLIPERWTTALTLAYVAFYLADYFLISGSFLTSTVHLVLFVLVVRLFSARRDRDYYFLSILAFLMVLAAAVLTVDSIFLLAFAAFMLMAVATFILMEMRYASTKATVRSRESVDSMAHRHMAFSLAGTAPLLMLLILMGAFVIFFVLPRISGGYLSAYAPNRDFATGFSEQVQLGQIGQIQQSNSLVMHIQIEGDTTGHYDLKWSGVTLNEFQGRSWRNNYHAEPVRRLPDGAYALLPPNPPAQSKNSIRYHVLMEPIGTNVFFLAATPQLLEGNYRYVSADRGGAVFDLDPAHLISRYAAISALPDRNASLSSASTDYPPEIQLNYLQLPPLDARIPKLATEITLKAANNYERATAIEGYLQVRYGYTLQLPNRIPDDPLANFLFERKAGHCEYFASSMAVMLRTLGIPSRIVNGFRTGEFNDLTGQYVVRASNAHSWVEAYFPDHGWVSFDPTPSAAPETHTGWGRAMLYVDAMASFWRDWVIDYDANHQQVLGHEASQNARAWLGTLRAWGRRQYQALLADARRAQKNLVASPSKSSLAAVLATLSLLLAANARRLWQAWQRHGLVTHPDRAPSTAATLWYERMTRTIAREGWRKLPAQTPSEFLGLIQDETLRHWVAQFTVHYENARFGNSADDACRLPELYREISAAVRGK